MDCRGLVDPNNKPFGRVLPLEVQVKIMFWVHCFHTMDKRKKVVQEFKGLPKCDLTGYPKVLGDYYIWNQVVTRLNTPQKNGCHHCHRLMDHRLSVRGIVVFFVFFVLLVDGPSCVCLVFQIGMMAEMARQPPNLDRLMNEGIAFVIDTLRHQLPHCPVGQLPVMIGRRKPSYDTLDKVMKRLDLIMNVTAAMNFIVIDIH